MSFSKADLLDANGMRAAHTTRSLLAGMQSIVQVELSWYS
jgi:hypothetical protein